MANTQTITPEAAINAIPAAFDKARASGDLLFFDSTVSTFTEAGVDFEIRECPALLQKPPLPTPHFDSGKELSDAPTDPFAPPYVKDLLIGEIEGEDDERYVILLNKYSVVPHHFLLVTKEWQSQNSIPHPGDLVTSYQLLIAARNANKPFFAFFNCGDRSGASQPHKHFQFIPTTVDGPPVERLAKVQRLEMDEIPFSIDSLPYAHHIFRLPSSSPRDTPEKLSNTLAEAFLLLLDLAISSIRHDANNGNNDHPTGTPSYNLVLTTEHLHIIPRSKEKHLLEGTGEWTSVNALGFAGMLLVKNGEEREAVKKEGVGKILLDVGAHPMDILICEPQNVEVDFHL